MAYISVEGNIGTGKSTMLRLLSNMFPNIVLVQEPVDKWMAFRDSSGENILNKFYRDQEKWSYAFQVLAFMTHLKDLQEVSESLSEPDYDPDTYSHNSEHTDSDSDTEFWSTSYEMNAMGVIKETRSLAKRPIKERSPPKKIVISERCLYTDRHVFALQLASDKKMSELEWRLYNDWFEWLTSDNGIPCSLKKPMAHIYLRASPETCAKRIQKRRRAEEAEIPLDYLHAIHRRHEEWLINMPNVLIIDCDKDFENDPEYMEEIRQRLTVLITDTVGTSS